MSVEDHCMSADDLTGKMRSNEPGGQNEKGRIPDSKRSKQKAIPGSTTTDFNQQREYLTALASQHSIPNNFCIRGTLSRGILVGMSSLLIG